MQFHTMDIVNKAFFDITENIKNQPKQNCRPSH